VNGLPAGTYFARTFAFGTVPYVDELYEDTPCLNCDVTAGTAIEVTAGTTRSGVNFGLAPGGRITGTVTDEGIGTGLSSMFIYVYTSSGTFATSAFTTGTGSFAVNGLPAGTYYVRTALFGALNYVDELYDNIPCLNCSVTSGTAIVLTAGTTRSGVDFALLPGGRITGTVTNAGTGTGLSGVSVQVYTSDGTFATSTSTTATGSYTVNGLPAGTYYARTSVFGALSYVDELYDDIPCLGCSVTSGVALVLTAGTTRSGVDFALAPGGRISGVVTDAGTEVGLSNVSVQVFTSTGTFARSASTTATGSYAVNGLPTGSYYARTFVFGTVSYLDELYDNIPCFNCSVTTGTAIAVTAGTTRSGVDFALSPGGSITGAVTDAATGTPLSGVTVSIYGATGLLAKSSVTNMAGTYTVNGLPAGAYFARTFVPTTQYYMDELWNDIPCLTCVVTTGEAIAVTNGVTRSGISFALLSAGIVTGTVTDAASGATLIGVTVQIYRSNGTFAKSAGTNSSGVYTVSGLPAGTYYARTAVPVTLNYANGLYANSACVNCVITTGTPITVTAGSTQTGIDFSLASNRSPTSTRVLSGTHLGLSLAHQDDERWASFEAVAGRSYCVAAVAAQNSVNRATPSTAAFRADATTSLGSATQGVCFIAPATETVLFRLKQTDEGTRQYLLRVQETTLWANWYFTGGDYSSYTILRNGAPGAGAVRATITWRGLNGDVSGAETVEIPSGGVIFRDARTSASGVAAGSVEVAFFAAPGAVLGTQSTISATTGQSFDTVFVGRNSW
jgi:hypothetical protein